MAELPARSVLGGADLFDGVCVAAWGPGELSAAHARDSCLHQDASGTPLRGQCLQRLHVELQVAKRGAMLQQLHKDNCWLLHQLQRSQEELDQAQRQLADQHEVRLHAQQQVSAFAPVIAC